MEMENNEQERIKLINLAIRFKNAFFQMWPLILVLAVAGGIFTGIRAKKNFVPMYESKAIFTVDAGYTPGDIFGTSAYYDQYAAEQMAAAFPRLLTTDMMRDLVIQQLDKGYIPGTATAEAIADSNMLRLTVTSRDPQDAYDYLTAIIECYPQVAVYMIENPQVKIVTSPNVPTEPYNDFSLVKSAAKGIALGAAAAILFIFCCALLTRTIQTTDELKESLNLPILVALPKVAKKRRRSGANDLLTADSDPNMTESFRGLRVKVKKMLEDPQKKTLLVTSTLAGEGKTTVAINLAMSLVQDGHKVVILDADLRSQSIARSLGEKAAGYGLMDCMRDPDLSVLDCLRSSETYKVDFISGRSTDKRHYSIDGNVIMKVLDELKQHYDYVIMDTPPVDVVSDTTTLCRYADCVLYVVKQDYAQKGQVINSVTALHQKDVKISGCIYNGVPRFHRHYGYGYRSAYGYGYDYGYRKYNYGSQYGYGYGYGYSKYLKKSVEQPSDEAKTSSHRSHHKAKK